MNTGSSGERPGESQRYGRVLVDQQSLYQSRQHVSDGTPTTLANRLAAVGCGTLPLE